MPIRTLHVGILEDDPDLRDYLASEVANAEDWALAFASETVEGAKSALARGVKVDICLVDLQLPDGNGSDFVRHLRKVQPEAKALVLTALGDRSSVLVAFESGANGYVLKDTPPEQIRRDIRAVIDGGNPISPQAATHLLGMLAFNKTEPESARESVLTEREREVLTLFAKGMSYRETAEVLEISPHTIRDYVKSIYRKLAVHSRNEAIFEAMQNGWLDL